MNYLQVYGGAVMVQQGTVRYGRMVLPVLAACGIVALVGLGAEKGDKPKPLPQDVVKAWGVAGAEAGWIRDESPERAAGYEYWEPYHEKETSGAIPAFRILPKKSDELAGLPDPGASFGVDLHCSPVTGDWLKKLANLKSLRSLNVGGSMTLTDQELKEITGLKELFALYLFYAPVTDNGAKEIAKLDKLQVLDLSYTRVKDGCLKELTVLTSLQALNLGETQVTDVGLKELAKIKSLRWLNVRRTNATPKGVAVLQMQLPKCEITSGDD